MPIQTQKTTKSAHTLRGEKKRRFLFCITGVGAGNTTRNLAILRELESLGPCRIQLAAQGRALELLREHYPTTPLQTVTYTSGSEFSPLDIARNNLAFPVRFRQNLILYERLLRRYQPDLVIADSDFYVLRPARRLGFRLASINNSAVIVESIRRECDLPSNCNFSYRFIEQTDYWLQRRFPHRVICPTLKKINGLPQKFHQIPPMVRPQIRPQQQPGDEVVVLTGGSGIGVEGLDLRAIPDGIPVRMLGTPPKKVPRHAQNIGFTLDVLEHLEKAKVLVIQGGFSSASEAAALRIPTVIVPIPNHAEQWVNGQMLQDLGLGVSAHENEAGIAVRRILNNYDYYWQNCKALRLRTDGHRHAARLIWRWASKR